MGAIRFEEYAPLGDFIMKSFERDQAAIEVRFPKVDGAYATAFRGKLAIVKQLEGTLVLTEEQKKATVELYAEADVVNNELNFLSAYFKDAGLPTDAIVTLKKALTRSNIEGALLQMKGLTDYIVANQTVLVDEGMAADFPTKLEDYRVSMAAKNTLQNSVLNARKTLVNENRGQYKELYAFIANIAKKGRLIFAGTVIEDEYNITKIVGRMRAKQ